jgi:hypothetical protein
MDIEIQQIIAQTKACQQQAKILYDALQDRISSDKLDLVLLPYRGNFAFRLCFKNSPKPENSNIKGLSISYPPDAMGNRGAIKPYFENPTPQTIETILIDTDDNVTFSDALGYDEYDVQRFSTIDQLIAHLHELVSVI